MTKLAYQEGLEVSVENSGDNMNCPKCGAAFEVVEYASIKVRRCTTCAGIWFDMLQHEDLKHIEGAESIDIGDAALAEKFNPVRRIHCPACRSKMIAMVDREQPHIWYEACTVCYGVFFDAGEFRDYTEKTVFDFFRDLFARERH